MFFVLAVFICYSLLTFGAVLPNSWFALAILWVSSIACCMLFRVFKERKWNGPIVLLFVLAVLLLGFGQSKLAVGLIAAAWAYAAAGDSNAPTLRFFHLLLLVGLLESLLGLTQYFISPGWIFGYMNVGSSVTGTLINRNHYAGMLEMIIPASLGLAYVASRRFGGVGRSFVYLLAGAFMGLTLFFSLSRTGILSFLVTMFFLAIVMQARKSQRRLAVGFTLTIVGLGLAGALWVGIDVVIQRYSELFREEAILRDGRLLVFRDTIRMIVDHPTVVGVGNFQDRFREYQTFRSDLLFDHAHNDYLETAAEWGMPLAMAFWTFIAFALVRAIRLFVSIPSTEQRGILLACMGAIFSILVHSFADFNLQIPSNAMLFFSFVGISLSVEPRYSEAEADE